MTAASRDNLKYLRRLLFNIFVFENTISQAKIKNLKVKQYL